MVAVRRSLAQGVSNTTMAKVTMMQVRRLRSVLFAVVFAAAGLVCGFVGGYLYPRLSPSLGEERLLKYCKRMDSRGGKRIWVWQRSEEFQYIRQHLDKYVNNSELISKTDSPSLSMMVWRAAFLFGSNKDISAAFDTCVGDANEVMAVDLASVYALRETKVLTDWLMLKWADEESVRLFLTTVVNKAPDRYGHLDYTPVLIDLMHHAKEEETRMHAAYCLARWKGGTKLGEEALSVLKSAKGKMAKWAARNFLDHIRMVGTHGWEDPQRSTQPSTRSSAE